MLRNSGLETATLERVETSCPCLEVGPLPLKIDPANTGELTVRFDPAEEPGFRGRLAIDLTGLAPDGQVAFRTRVCVEVRAET